MYDSVLVPTDGSEQAANAVEEAIRLAGELDAGIHALYVVDEFEAKIVPITGAQERKRAEYREFGESVVGEVGALAEEAGLECTTAVRTGLAHREIVGYAREADVDMIVMGSRGLGNVEELLLGSTADKVIRLVDRPVTVVYERPREELRWMLPSAEDTIHR